MGNNMIKNTRAGSSYRGTVYDMISSWARNYILHIQQWHFIWIFIHQITSVSFYTYITFLTPALIFPSVQESAVFFREKNNKSSAITAVASLHLSVPRFPFTFASLVLESLQGLINSLTWKTLMLTVLMLSFSLLTYPVASQQPVCFYPYVIS